MIKTSLLRTRVDTPLKRIVAVLLVTLFESVLVVYCWRSAAPTPILAFLAKSAQGYVVTWKDNTGYEMSEHKTLTDAVRFLKEELRLSQAKNPLQGVELEHLWVQDRFGKFMVMWKTGAPGGLNQITFNSHDEASFFARAFRRGTYSPSPIGHSILYLPVENN